MESKKTLKGAAAVLLFSLVFAPLSHGDFEFSAGWGGGNFYFHVGRYDYYHYDGDILEVSFYDILGDYGRWIYIPYFGRVWSPYVSVSWRPYTLGHWIYTHYGWTWVAYEPWGWIPMHYGEWIYYPGYGWCWIPGYEWAPARVEFCYVNGYMGWHPLPPLGWTFHYDGYRGYFSNRRFFGLRSYRINIEINLWNFVEHRVFYGGGYCGEVLERSSHTGAFFRNGTVRYLGRRIGHGQSEKLAERSISTVTMTRKTLKIGDRDIDFFEPAGQVNAVRSRMVQVKEKYLKPGFERHNVRPVGAVKVDLGNSIIAREVKDPNGVSEGAKTEGVRIAEKAARRVELNDRRRAFGSSLSAEGRKVPGKEYSKVDGYGNFSHLRRTSPAPSSGSDALTRRLSRENVLEKEEKRDTKAPVPGKVEKGAQPPAVKEMERRSLPVRANRDSFPEAKEKGGASPSSKADASGRRALSSEAKSAFEKRVTPSTGRNRIERETRPSSRESEEAKREPNRKSFSKEATVREKAPSRTQDIPSKNGSRSIRREASKAKKSFKEKEESQEEKRVRRKEEER